MHNCKYRIVEDKLRCQIHVDNGVTDLFIDGGICEKCLFFQSHRIEIEKASISMMADYVNSHFKYIKLFLRPAANELFDKLFNYSKKIHTKDRAMEFLTDVLVKFSENPHIKEEDLERAYDFVKRFEEAS